MQIAILSDTHNNKEGVVWVIKHLNKQNVKTILHAGDIVNPDILQQFIDHYNGDFHFVFGNNQRQQQEMIRISNTNSKITCYEYTMEKEISGKKVFMNHYTHISIQAAQTNKYDLCIGGHTHQYQVKTIHNTLFINPGNVVADDGTPRNKVSSIVLLDINNFTHEQIIVPK